MGLPEILIIAVAVLVLFGAKKIPEMMKGVGKGIREFSEEKDKGRSDEAEDNKA